MNWSPYLLPNIIVLISFIIVLIRFICDPLVVAVSMDIDLLMCYDIKKLVDKWIEDYLSTVVEVVNGILKGSGKSVYTGSVGFSETGLTDDNKKINISNLCSFIQEDVNRILKFVQSDMKLDFDSEKKRWEVNMSESGRNDNVVDTRTEAEVRNEGTKRISRDENLKVLKTRMLGSRLMLVLY
ncbi:hypothetical protein ACET3Z_020219 [Daucus carota]